VSAFDGVLDAEKEMAVVGPMPNFTATFSFGVCWTCLGYSNTPGLGQMRALRRAMEDPESVGYRPRNNVWGAYLERFENSVNTANPAKGRGGFKGLFLDSYIRHFPSVPVFIGEYHAPQAMDLRKDVEAILELAEDPSNQLTGISFFEFQVRYDKGGSEMKFGIFGLGEEAISQVAIGAPTAMTGAGAYPVWCLHQMLEPNRVAQGCREVVWNVEFVADGTSSLQVAVPSPAHCCAKCTESPFCGAWTWRSLGGHCLQLSLAAPRRRLRLPQNSGFASGLPAGGGGTRATLSAPAAVAAAFRGSFAEQQELFPGLCSASVGASGEA